MRNGWESAGDDAYSPGRIKKKKAMHAMSATAMAFGLAALCAADRACRRTETGSGFVRLGGGSDFP